MVKSDSPDGPKTALSAASVDKSTTAFELEGKELLTYFANLSADDRQGILSQLRERNEGDAFFDSSLDRSQPPVSNDNEVLYEDIIASRRSKKVASHELKSGLQISLAPRTSRDLGCIFL